MIRLFAFFVALASVAFAIPAVLKAQCITGTVKVQVFDVSEGEEPDDEEKDKAKLKARSAAWQGYINSLEANYLKAYMTNKQKIDGELGFYISNEIVSSAWDESSEILTVKNCITINKERLKTALNVKPKVRSGKGSRFVTLFVAREALKAETFDGNVRKARSARTLSKSLNKSKEIAIASGGTAIATSSQKAMTSNRSKTSSSGSTVRRSDQISYKIISSNAADGAMSKSLTDAGFESSLYKDVQAFCGGVSEDEVKETFKNKEELTGPQRVSAMKSSIACKGKFFALGTMTADVARTHMQTGLKQVAVRVQGEIYNLTDFPPIRIATIPPQQFQGLGPSQDEARTNALFLAGTEAGKIITKSLQDKGIQ